MMALGWHIQALLRKQRGFFDDQLEYPCQLGNKREDVRISASDLLKLPVKTAGGKIGIISEQGICTNINIGILYIEAWLKGNGCVPLYDLMEDAATAEISRAQIWQWLHHKATTVDGKKITLDYYNMLLNQELEKIKETVGAENYNRGKYKEATEIFNQMTTSKTFEDFLTLQAYNYL